MKKLILVILPILLIGSVLAMNLWMSWTIFTDINVPAGYHGEYVVHITETLDRIPMISWGTKDNATYILEVTAEGEGGRFFKKYKKEVEISNLQSYKYDVYLNVPKGARQREYPYELCGTICNEQNSMCLAICKSGDVIVNGSLKK